MRLRLRVSWTGLGYSRDALILLNSNGYGSAYVVEKHCYRDAPGQ